jgi:hypothetical protein
MMALRVRWWGVMSSELLIDYLLEDGREFFMDLRLQSGREARPEGGGLDGHNTSHWVASVTSSWIACAVSFVRDTGRDGLRLVAASGMRKSMDGR